jgi:hypothetical protein
LTVRFSKSSDTKWCLPHAAFLAAQRAEASEGFRLGMERDGIFGVPSFIYAGRLYWGQYRMHFLASAVARKTVAQRPSSSGDHTS